MTALPVMLAVRAEQAGAPAQLRAGVVARPAPGAGELLVAVRAAGVNRSDVLACRGILPGPFPRTLGRDFAGDVVAGPPGWAGRRVWGTGGGDIGLAQDGSHAQFLRIPTAAAVQIPDSLEYVEAGASGLAYFTAAAAWELVGGLAAGSTVAVTGAVGGVGSAAAAIARYRGARVIGIVRGARQEELAGEAGLDVVLRCDDGSALGDAIRAAADGGAAAAVDTVGGPLTARLLAGMAIRGRICLLSTPPEDAVAAVDLLEFYRREIRLAGLHTGRLTACDSARLLTELAPGFGSGALPPTRVYRTYGLSAAADAYRAIEAHAPGRPVLIPHLADDSASCN